jgi:hypothetical protein
METRVNGKISLQPKEVFDAKSVGVKNLEGGLVWTKRFLWRIMKELIC